MKRSPESPSGGPSSSPADEPTPADQPAQRRLLYFADPMCSWCWGFHPVVEELGRELGSTAPLQVLMGGLRPGTTEVLAESSKADIRRHWEHVHSKTGQPFDFSFFDRPDFIYDTEPASRAVVAVRSLDAQSAVHYLGCVQEAFYAHNRDVTSLDVLEEVACVSCSVDRSNFRTAISAPEIVSRTHNDFLLSRELGINGFPTLIGQSREGLVPLARGYTAKVDLAPMMDRWLERSSG